MVRRKKPAIHDLPRRSVSGGCGPRCRAVSKTASAWPSKLSRLGSGCRRKPQPAFLGCRCLRCAASRAVSRKSSLWFGSLSSRHSAAAAWRPGLAVIYSELGLTGGRARGIREPGAARLRRPAPRRGVDGNHDLSRGRLHFPWGSAPALKRCTRFSCPSPGAMWSLASGSLLRRPLPLPGCVGYHPRALGRRGAPF